MKAINNGFFFFFCGQIKQETNTRTLDLLIFCSFSENLIEKSMNISNKLFVEVDNKVKSWK
jgi:hypothetical protein